MSYTGRFSKSVGGPKDLQHDLQTLRKFNSLALFISSYIGTRGVMPIQSEGARAPLDFWAKWILNAASKRQKIAD